TAGSFSCSSVSAGTPCQLSLTYAPTMPTMLASNTLSLTYSYNNNSGTSETRTVSIPYVATQAHLYVAQASGVVSYCMLATDGTTTGCTAVGASAIFNTPTGIAFYGSGYAYVADEATNVVYLCNVIANGDFPACINSGGTGFQAPWNLAVNGNTLYAANAGGGVTACTIGVAGTLSGCNTGSGGGTVGIAVNADFAYVSVGASEVDVCAIGLPGTLPTNCVSTGGPFSSPGGIALAGGYAYIANSAVGVGTVSGCLINAGGALSCGPTFPVSANPIDIAINGSLAYVDDVVNGDIYLCPVGALG